MPAWIWRPQIAAFAPAYRVVAFDPRGQGDSEIAPDRLRSRRGAAATSASCWPISAPTPVLLVGWSLGVLDTLAEVHVEGDAHLAGLVLVDNSVGEEPPPQPAQAQPCAGRCRTPRSCAPSCAACSAARRAPAYLDRLTEAALRTPEPAARALLSYPVPRSYWREAVYAARVPVLYVVRPRFAAQAANLRRNRPDTETAVFRDAGHALFVDDAARFNALMQDFIRRHVWP